MAKIDYFTYKSHHSFHPNKKHLTQLKINPIIPWCGGTDNEEATATGNWEDVEGISFIAHPVKALTLETDWDGVNRCTKLNNK